MLSAHYKLFYPVIVDEERLHHYISSVCAQNMTHRGPMGDNKKISPNTQICLFQEGKEHYTRLKAQIKLTTTK